MHLSALQTSEKSFNLLNLSLAVELADSLGIDIEAPFALQALEKILSEITKMVAGEFSGLILSPEIGFPALDEKNNHTGLLISLHSQTITQQVQELPKIIENWSVPHVRNNYGVVYIKLYYNPYSANATQKWQMVSEVYDMTRYEGCDLVLELSLYPEESQPVTKEMFAETQLFAALQMQSLTDLLILEYPHSALAAATLTAQLDVPWIVVDRTDDYGYFKEVTRTCLESGAQGVCVGPCLWSNIPPLGFDHGKPDEKSWQSIQNYIHTEMRDRSLELMRIVKEGVVGQLSTQLYCDCFLAT